ncbi:MAG: efflux RND transporter permease subunit [Odoribacter sp.]|nr:efflux RND transporter permease subunit [Odoribacter sp.]
MSIFVSAVEKPITTLMIFVGIMVLGIFSLVQLPIDQYPEMDPPYLSVMTNYAGANAEDIEENITRILEDQLNSVENLKELTSSSYDDLSVITLEFEWGANLDEASNDVRDAIDKSISQLPDDVDRPTLLKFNTSMMPVIMYTITAEESYPGIYKILDDKVVNRLNRIDGVASASIVGAPTRVVYVDLDPVKLDAYNLTLEQLGNLIAAENQDLPAGSVKMGLMEYQFRIEGELTASEEINDIVVGSSNGKSIYIRDIASVRDTIKDITLEQLIDRQQGAVLMITKQSGANTVNIAKQVIKEMEQVKKELPPDIKVEILVDSSDFIMKSINNLSETLMYALIFVVLVVLFFLGRWRATFIIALTIPISLIVAFIYLYITGESLNIISLTSLSIAIGMVVDDAIVVLENITKHIERGSAPREAAKYGTNEVWLSVIVTTLVTIAIFFPMTLVGGMTGILFKQLGWIVCITVTTSTTTAITLTPMLSSQMLKLFEKQPEEAKKKFSYNTTIMRLLDRLDGWYEGIIKWCLRHKTVIILSAIVVFVGSFMMVGFIKTDFMPQNDESRLNVYVKMQTGQRVEETKRVALQIDSMMRVNYPEIKLINLSYGSEEEDAGFASLFNKTGGNILNIRARLVDIADRERSVFDIADDLRDRLREIPDVLVYTVTTSSSSSISDNNLDIEIMGFDFEQTNKLAQEISQKMEGIPGAEDINISRDDDKPELRLYLDQEKLSKHGLTTSQVASALRYRIYGYKPTKYKENGEEYDVIVRLEEKYRNTLTELENIQIINNVGDKIRLSELSEIREYWSPPNIERKSKQRIVKVSVTPARGASLGDIAEAAQVVIDGIHDIPQDVSIYIGGSYEDQQEAFSSLVALLLLGLMLVYIVMASEFESFKMPFIIMLSIPFAFSGVVLALLITNTTLSVIAALGAVMLIGIVTKNGIVLIDFINLMRERGHRLYEAIAIACRSRLRPVLMTAMTTILGMLPMALSTGEGSETWKPMGIAVIGGLVFSTIVTMVIVPVVYAAMDKSGSRNKKKALSKQYRFMKDFDPERDLPRK